MIWAEMGSKPSQNMKGCGMLLSQELASILRTDDPYLSEPASRVGSTNGTMKCRAKLVLVPRHLVTVKLSILRKLGGISWLLLSNLTR